MTTKRLISWLLAFLPLIITLFALPALPDQIPAHYGFNGEVTRYGSKYETLILPLITIAMGFFWLLTEKSLIKKDKEKGIQNAKVILWVFMLVSLIFTALQLWLLNLAYTSAETIFFGDDSDYLRLMAVCVSIAWIVTGNLLPKCKQNYIVGIRTKWTLKSEVSWYKTHRLGGKIMFVFGIISTVICLFIPDSYTGLILSFGGFLVLIIPITIYSYYVYKQQPLD